MAEALGMAVARPTTTRSFIGRPWLPIALYAVLALPVAVFNLNTINHDAVSYVSLAQHYLDGRFDIALSGTWSPLFIWLVAGALGVVHDPFVALRIAMALSGLVFTLGCIDSLKHLAPPRQGWAVGVLCVAFAAIATGGLITPDLLSAGIFLIGYRLFLEALASGDPRRCLVAGLVLGVAFIAKSVFLPIGLASVIAATVAMGWIRRESARHALYAALAVLGIVLASAPWVAALSAKYDHFTVTRANIPQFALIGPPDKNRDQPTNRLFFVPEPGRQSQFEDESILPNESWSPFESMKYFRYYVRHTVDNVPTIAHVLRDLELTGIGLFVLPFAFAAAVRRSRRAGTPDLDWGWLAIPVALTIAAYMLNFANQSRYFLIALPPLLTGTLIGLEHLGRLALGRHGRAIGGTAAIALILLTFGMQAEKQNALQNETLLPQMLPPIVNELRRAGLVGPIATLSANEKMQAIVLSFLLGTTYNGTQNIGAVDEIEASCARLLIARRNSPQDLLLLGAPEKVRLINGPRDGIGPAAAAWGFDAFWVVDPNYANWRCRTSPPSE